MLLDTLVLLAGLLVMGIEAAYVPTDGGGGSIWSASSPTSSATRPPPTPSPATSPPTPAMFAG